MVGVFAKGQLNQAAGEKETQMVFLKTYTAA